MAEPALEVQRTEGNRKIEEDDICVGEDVVCFKYLDEDKKNRIYYPDMMLKNTKHIYEVKSVYTFNLNYKRNFCKFMSLDGYILHVIIFENKKNILDIWTIENKKIVSKVGIKNFKRKISIPDYIPEDDIEIIADDLEYEKIMKKTDLL